MSDNGRTSEVGKNFIQQDDLVWEETLNAQKKIQGFLSPTGQLTRQDFQDLKRKELEETKKKNKYSKLWILHQTLDDGLGRKQRLVQSLLHPTSHVRFDEF
jgi:predicted esterase YcpF (UPF0227 family)